MAWSRPYKAWSAYGYSKLANILFVKELANQLPKEQTVNALHPGIIDSNLWRHVPSEASKYKLKSVEHGAATGVFLATHSSVEGVTGQYFTNCAPGKASSNANNVELASQLWDRTEEIVSNF